MDNYHEGNRHKTSEALIDTDFSVRPPVIIHVKSVVDDAEINVRDRRNGAGGQLGGVFQLMRGTVSDGGNGVQRLRIEQRQNGIDHRHREKRRNCKGQRQFHVFLFSIYPPLLGSKTLSF